jgi:uncharacterized protein with NRDE domain
VFITSEHYGTRSSSVILIEKSGEVTFVERSFALRKQGATVSGTREYRFRIENL